MSYIIIRSCYLYIPSILNPFMFSNSHTNHFPDTAYMPPYKSSKHILLGVSLSPPVPVFQVLVSLIPHNIKETIIKLEEKAKGSLEFCREDVVRPSFCFLSKHSPDRVITRASLCPSPPHCPQLASSHSLHIWCTGYLQGQEQKQHSSQMCNGRYLFQTFHGSK